MKKYKYLAFILLIAISTYVSITTEKTNKREELLEDYNGLITGIRYDPKTIPFVTINHGKEYYLGNYPIQKTNNFEIGDSVVKKANSNILKHYKKYNNGFYLYESYKISK